MPSEEEEDEVNRGMRTEQIAEIINRHRLHVRKDGQLVTSNQVYAVVCRYPDTFVKAIAITCAMMLASSIRPLLIVISIVHFSFQGKQFYVFYFAKIRIISAFRCHLAPIIT